jgi:hypothetical protein
MDGIGFRERPALSNAAPNELFSVGWPSWQQQPDRSEWQPETRRGGGFRRRAGERNSFEASPDSNQFRRPYDYCELAISDRRAGH